MSILTNFLKRSKVLQMVIVVVAKKQKSFIVLVPGFLLLMLLSLTMSASSSSLSSNVLAALIVGTLISSQISFFIEHSLKLFYSKFIIEFWNEFIGAHKNCFGLNSTLFGHFSQQVKADFNSHKTVARVYYCLHYSWHFFRWSKEAARTTATKKNNIKKKCCCCCMFMVGRFGVSSSTYFATVAVSKYYFPFITWTIIGHYGFWLFKQQCISQNWENNTFLVGK